MSEFVFYAIYICVAILGSCLVVFFFGAGLAVVSKIGTRVLPWVFPLIGASVVLGTVANHRNVDLYVQNPASGGGAESGLTVWVLRACGWSILSLCGAFILSSLFNPQTKLHFAKPLFLSFLAYFFFASLMNGLLGTAPSIDYKVFYVPLVVTAFYIGQSISAQRLIWYAKTTGIVSILLGLIAAIVYPSIAVQTNFRSILIPWPPIRLWGLDSHANTLGPMVVMVLLLEFGSPYRSKLTHWGAVMCGVVTLFLTQSKTSWATFIVAGLVFWFLNLSTEALNDIRRFRFKVINFIVITGVIVVFFGLVFYIAYGGVDNTLARFMASSDGASISSMTGRDVIWNITLAEWKKNILFGYGPELWGPKFSAQYHLLGIASNAHNQLVDVIGSSGILGISAFLAYFFFLAKYAIVSKKVIGWLPVALLTALSVRSISEVPFKLVNLSSNDFAFHLILLSIIFSSINRINSSDQNDHPNIPFTPKTRA